MALSWKEMQAKQGAANKAAAPAEAETAPVKTEAPKGPKNAGGMPGKVAPRVAAKSSSSKPTQRQRAEAALAAQDVDALDAVLGEAQNGPPDGAADGSLTEKQWNALRTKSAALRAMNAPVEEAQSEDSDATEAVDPVVQGDADATESPLADEAPAKPELDMDQLCKLLATAADATSKAMKLVREFKAAQG